MQKLNPLLAAMPDNASAAKLSQILTGIYRRLNSVTLTSPALVIKARASALVKTGATATTVSVEGVLASIAAATDMPALVGTVTADLFNVYVFSQDRAGTRYTTMGTEAATLAGVKFPSIPDNRAVIGFIVVNPTGTGNFVGGTTALDDATVAPNVVYNNTVGAFCVTAALA